MKTRNILIILTVLISMCLCAETVFADTITTKDYFVLRDRTMTFTGGKQVVTTESARSQCNLISEPVFGVNYFGNSHHFLNYDSEGNLIFYGNYYGSEYVYIPQSGGVQWLPCELEIGESYTSKWSRDEYTYSSCVSSGPGSDSLSITVTGPEQVTVSSYTFEAYKLVYVDNWKTSLGVEGTTTFTYWLAKDVGWVKMILGGATYELESYTPPLSVNPSIISISAGQTGSCAISGGTDPYSASSSNTSVATASVSGSTLIVTGVSDGSATVTVSDSGSDSATVSVTVLATRPSTPTMTLTTSGTAVTVSWTPAATATGYQLFYAPAPYTGPDSIGSFDMGPQTGCSFDLWEGAAYYLAVQAYNSFGNSGYSNIGHFAILYSLSVSPTSLSISAGQTGSCSISGGTSVYSASSSNASVATASISGSTLTVTGVSAGSASVTVSDSGSDSATVSVAVVDLYTNGLGQIFVFLPAATFTMGSPSDEPGRNSDEGPQHQVTLTQPFYMQTTEVTQGQWEAVMDSNPSFSYGCPTCPVEQVSWNDVQSYITEMNRRGEGTYRLPTEAEWAYAARAGSTTAFANGGITELECGYDSNLDAIGWYCYNSGDKTHPVAQKTPNAWDLYDMSGNVWEWCQDWYGSYSSSAVTDPTGPSSGAYRVIRGGYWANDAKHCRSANRTAYDPASRSKCLGFRLLRQP